VVEDGVEGLAGFVVAVLAWTNQGAPEPAQVKYVDLGFSQCRLTPSGSGIQCVGAGRPRRPSQHSPSLPASGKSPNLAFVLLGAWLRVPPSDSCDAALALAGSSPDRKSSVLRAGRPAHARGSSTWPATRRRCPPVERRIDDVLASAVPGSVPTCPRTSWPNAPVALCPSSLPTSGVCIDSGRDYSAAVTGSSSPPRSAGSPLMAKTSS
jgi:hypothetical protein